MDMMKADVVPNLREEVRAVNELVQQESVFIDSVLSEIGRVIVGQRDMIERLLIGMLTGGHVLLEGVPGLAKTLTVKTLADVLDTSFKRIQFTPDLLPADLIGTQVYHQHSGQFSVKRGPIFANLILADEINRAPAKVQSALLEAMQERQVTIADDTHVLPSPFMVMATQNPIEQEGTYPLPEAQVDRFMLMVKVGYPTKEEERRIMERMAVSRPEPVQKVVRPEDIARAGEIVRKVYIDEKLKDYLVDIVHATREPGRYGLSDIAGYIEYGASPRATIYLNVAARAHAFLRHRGFVTPEDIKAIGLDVLRHRVAVTYEAEADEISSEHIVRRVFESVEVP